MVEFGESSFTYLQIFYSLDYGIPVPSYKILCLVLALIFHIGCYIKDFESTNLIFSHYRCLVQTTMIFPNLLKMVSLNIMLHFLHLLQLFSLTHKFEALKSSNSLKPFWQVNIKKESRCVHTS